MRLSSDPQGAYRGAVPRGMIVVLLVLLAAGLAAWLLVDSGASGVRQGHLGEDATPLWIPQLPMAFGAILLAVCFADNLLTLLVIRRDNIRHATLDQPAE